MRTGWNEDDDKMMDEIFARYHRADISDVTHAQVAFDIGRLQGTISRLRQELMVRPSSDSCWGDPD